MPRSDPMHRITILLVEDHHLVREGFRGLLKLDPGLVVPPLRPTSSEWTVRYGCLTPSAGSA